MKYFMVFEDGEVVEEGEFSSMEETIEIGEETLGMEDEEFDEEIQDDQVTVLTWLETAYVMIGEKEVLETYR